MSDEEYDNNIHCFDCNCYQPKKGWASHLSGALTAVALVVIALMAALGVVALGTWAALVLG